MYKFPPDPPTYDPAYERAEAREMAVERAIDRISRKLESPSNKVGGYWCERPTATVAEEFGAWVMEALHENDLTHEQVGRAMLDKVARDTLIARFADAYAEREVAADFDGGAR